MNGRGEDSADPVSGPVTGPVPDPVTDPVPDLLSDLLSGAQASVAWVPPARLGGRAGDVAATAERLAHLTRRGVHVRVLCPHGVAEQREYLALLARHTDSLEPRVSRHHWPEQLVVDERVAMLVTHGTGDGAVVVHGHPVVTTLTAVFHAAWDASAALPPPVPDESRLATEPARRILDLLGAGYRDAAAASELGLSIRTYRRHVAELMTELSAASRFQAGMRATQLGLLPRDPPSEPMHRAG